LRIHPAVIPQAAATAAVLLDGEFALGVGRSTPGTCWRRCDEGRRDQANANAWVDQILPPLTDDDPLGVDGFATHHLRLAAAPEAYEHFQKKGQGMIKLVFNP
jgi:hypothetical protein